MRQVFKDLPFERSVPGPLAPQFFKGLQKPVPIVPPDLIFHGHQHWPSIGLDVRYQHGSGQRMDSVRSRSGHCVGVSVRATCPPND